ncbi:MAG TPA: LamG-like jellyroll fold domain-containing protein, partial [Polyangiaceae bacterium]|nr:LamG-like jellyroll fold domain-containing protein [Polyangiaceae bacterium]
MARRSMGDAASRYSGALFSALLGCVAPTAQPSAAPATAPAAEAPATGVPAAPVATDAPSCPVATAPTALRWTADGAALLGTVAPVRLGGPRVEQSPHGDALCFDGKGDGLAFDQNPIAGLEAFTVQVLFRPDASGTPEAPSEQRFIHFEEGAATTPDSRRALIETRVVGDEWFLDTYLRAAKGNRALIDAEKKHPVGRWYWVALTFGDGTMRHYIDGQLELQGEV